MIRWVRYESYGHIIVSEEDPVTLACGQAIELEENDEILETETLVARPFGADTHPECHAQVKIWAHEPENLPPAIKAALESAPTEPKRMTAADRAAALKRATGGPSEPGSAPDTSRKTAARRGTTESPGDDIDFPPEPGGVADTGGALFVAPAGNARGKSRRSAPAEIDDIDV